MPWRSGGAGSPALRGSRLPGARSEQGLYPTRSVGARDASPPVIDRRPDAPSRPTYALRTSAGVGSLLHVKRDVGPPKVWRSARRVELCPSGGGTSAHHPPPPDRPHTSPCGPQLAMGTHLRTCVPPPPVPAPATLHQVGPELAVGVPNLPWGRTCVLASRRPRSPHRTPVTLHQVEVAYQLAMGTHLRTCAGFPLASFDVTICSNLPDRSSPRSPIDP